MSVSICMQISVTSVRVNNNAMTVFLCSFVLVNPLTSTVAIWVQVYASCAGPG